MKHQSVKWKDLALGYSPDIVTIVRNFVWLISYMWCVLLKEFERAFWLWLWIDCWSNLSPQIPTSSFCW